MTFTANSSLVGYQPPRAGWQDALTAHGAANVAAIIAAYAARAAVYDLDANLALAQACQECAWFTDWKWTDRFNPCGLGVTSRAEPGPLFASIEQGIEAHLQHLCDHAYLLATCPVETRGLPIVDPRHAFHKGQPMLGDLETPPFKWAVPGDGYIAAICAIGNSVGGTPVATYPSAADIGAPIRIETTDFVGPDRALANIKWFVVHDTEGHYEGDIGVLTHGSRNGSIHAIIGREPGQFCVSVPITTTAWAAGNDTLGALAVQVELSKAPQSGEVGYTDTQYQYLAAFFRWCVAQGMTGVGTRYYWPHPPDADGGPLPDVPGIIGHYGVPNPDKPGQWGGFAGHTDPGDDFDWPRFVALLGNAPPPTPGPPPDLRVFPETGKGIFGNIKGYYEQFGDDALSLAIFGLPVTDLVYENGLPVQYFERAVLEDHAGNVMGRRLGAAAAAAAGHTGPGI